jgi:DNA topoisomerase-3
MKAMVSSLVAEVKLEQKQQIDIAQVEEPKPEKANKTSKDQKKATKEQVAKVNADITSLTCPKCGSGKILKGNAAYGCSGYKSGCTFRVMFEQFGKQLTNEQAFSLIEKGKSPKITGMVINGQTVDAVLVFDGDYNVIPDN